MHSRIYSALRHYSRLRIGTAASEGDSTCSTAPLGSRVCFGLLRGRYPPSEAPRSKLPACAAEGSRTTTGENNSLAISWTVSFVTNSRPNGYAKAWNEAQAADE